jgi:hypothetical protein
LHQHNFPLNILMQRKAADCFHISTSAHEARIVKTAFSHSQNSWTNWKKSERASMQKKNKSYDP